jgi:hypothetical protein
MSIETGPETSSVLPVCSVIRGWVVLRVEPEDGAGDVVGDAAQSFLVASWFVIFPVFPGISISPGSGLPCARGPVPIPNNMTTPPVEPASSGGPAGIPSDA